MRFFIFGGWFERYPEWNEGRGSDTQYQQATPLDCHRPYGRQQPSGSLLGEVSPNTPQKQELIRLKWKERYTLNYLELEKEQRDESGKRLRQYAEKISAWKEKKGKEAEGNVGTQGICRGSGKGY